ncbi:hypothetical protein [Streptomyces sp. CB01881]|uniref:hypothetical protein n=1 Tax=Streptomyces sp. CB01881 TaxID=2078691 RepID=UPI000CDBB1A7|nr:hypothetical protein [Streptomyces sp. CB01881]AUY52881.1 hypothetical protein C2142_32670 [Streptomyces sp. CB01881]TYC70597.1 hypothetical protein EH183_32735 [Streptomyces sp. CB01881]
MIDENRADGPDAYLAGLPIGEPLPFPVDGAPSWDIFPYEGELRVKALVAPELPEPPRQGEEGPESCKQCARPDEDFLWTDEHWRLSTTDEPSGLPPSSCSSRATTTTCSTCRPGVPPSWARCGWGHLPAEGWGRVEAALLSLGGIGRVHVNRWGDGAAHLHLWLIARPAGMMQLRGSTLPLWMDVLPPLSAEAGAATVGRIAAAMAAGGGTAHA